MEQMLNSILRSSPDFINSVREAIKTVASDVINEPDDTANIKNRYAFAKFITIVDVGSNNVNSFLDSILGIQKPDGTDEEIEAWENSIQPLMAIPTDEEILAIVNADWNVISNNF